MKKIIYKLYDDIYSMYLFKSFNRTFAGLASNYFNKKYYYYYVTKSLLAPFYVYIREKFFYNNNLITNNKCKVKNKIWLLSGSKTANDSIRFIEDKLNSKTYCLVTTSKMKYQRKKIVYQIDLSKRVKYFYKLPGYYKHLKNNGYNPWKHLFFLNSTFGVYEVLRRMLKQIKPKAIVFPGDHGPIMRAFINAAKDNNVPAIYIQHASVNENHPPLQFDLSLLEGQDSLNKYKKIGNIQGRIELIGMPKFDNFMKYRNFEKDIKVIGISIGLGDDLSKVEQLLEKIKNHFPKIRLHIRPHPGEGRSTQALKKIADDYSDSKKEHVFSFLQKVDINIAANTSTHLEAVLMNIPSLFYPFEENKQRYDDYNYIRDGLIEEFTTIESIVQWIEIHKNNRPEVLHKVKYYLETIGTKFDGKSGELAIKYITEFLKLKENHT